MCVVKKNPESRGDFDPLVSPAHSLALFDFRVKVGSIMRDKMCMNTAYMHAHAGPLCNCKL